MEGGDRQRALVEAGIALASELDLDGVLTKLVETAASLTGASYAALGVIGRDGRSLGRFVTFGITEDERAAIGELPRGRGILGALIEDARPLRLRDLATDPRSVGFPPGHPPMRTFLGVPVLLRGVAYGNLYLTEKRDGAEFTADDEEVTTILAAQAAVAVDNARRVERDALERAVAAQEVERRRLARELHDGIGQSLTSVLLGLGALERAGPLGEAHAEIDALRELVVETLQDVRRMAVELRPKALDDFGLVPALRRLGHAITETSGLVVHVEARLGSARLPAALETAIYRIAQEALTNTLRHAAARHASIVLTRKNTTVSVVIEDDGSGFDTEAGVDGTGLAGMRERVGLFDGVFAVEAAPGKGTTLLVDLPVPGGDP